MSEGYAVVCDWPPDLQLLADRVLNLTPDDLPPTPWTLYESPFREIGRSFAVGGPFITVRDNVLYLEATQRDVRAGAQGPRNRWGALAAELRLLCWILDHRSQ